MFPVPVHFSRNDSPGWKIRDWETANKLLSYLELNKRPFAIFSLPDESYIQCLGEKTRLTVEARVYRADRLFSHWVFGRGVPTGTVEAIEVSSGVITVDRSQLLKLSDARIIIRQFLETQTFAPEYHRLEVTHRFAG